MGSTPRYRSSPGMRIGISASTAAVLASITVTVSSLALETNTRPAAARIPEGLLPPCTFGPNGRPVRMKVSNFGAAGAETTTTLTQLDSRTLVSPTPGTVAVPPVRVKVSNFGAAGAETSPTLTELDSRTLGSPRPGTLTGPRTVARSAPATASPLGNPKAGKPNPVASACFISAPGTAWYSNMPRLVT